MATEDRGLVAITGANGTIGYACVVYALQAGYRVRCIVRHDDAYQTIKKGISVQQFLDRIECAIVPDNTIDGAYNEVVVGSSFIVHIAGAWPMPHLHPDNDIYYPFIKSTKNMIKAAKKVGTIRRIVFTQAGAGLVDSDEGDTLGNRMDKILDENIEVNTASLIARPPLKSAHHAYTAAKAQCMRYLNDLSMSRTLPFSIAQVIPGTVIGPSEFVTTPAQAIVQVDRQTKALLFDDMTPRYAFGFVHVRDCARVHIEALDESKVKTEDIPPWYVAAATVKDGYDGEKLWREAVDMVESVFKAEIAAGLFKVGRDRAPINMPYRVDSTRTQRMLLNGEDLRGLQESVREVAQWYVKLQSQEEGNL